METKREQVMKLVSNWSANCNAGRLADQVMEIFGEEEIECGEMFVSPGEKFDVELGLQGNTVTLKVNGQPRRGEGPVNPIVFKEKGNFSVRSASRPEIIENKLYLRGWFSKRDEDVGKYVYESAEEARVAFDAFVRMIKGLNKKDRTFRSKGQPLDIELKRKGKKLTARIFRVPPACIVKPTCGAISLGSKGLYGIESVFSPQLSRYKLYVWGRNGSTSAKELTHFHENKRDAKEAFKALKRIIEKFNDEHQQCGHDKSSIRGFDDTHWCVECECEKA